MNWVKDWYAHNTNENEEKGSVHQVIKGADVFLGLSVPGVINAEDLAQMANKPIVFAMANPTPEIMPAEAAPYVAVMATGRSDYANQINNVLSFPGIFRGALACRASRINEEMKAVYGHQTAKGWLLFGRLYLEPSTRKLQTTCSCCRCRWSDWQIQTRRRHD